MDVVPDVYKRKEKKRTLFAVISVSEFSHP